MDEDLAGWKGNGNDGCEIATSATPSQYPLSFDEKVKERAEVAAGGPRPMSLPPPHPPAPRKPMPLLIRQDTFVLEEEDDDATGDERNGMRRGDADMSSTLHTGGIRAMLD